MLFERFDKHVWWSNDDISSAASLQQHALGQLRSDLEFYLQVTGKDPDLTKRFGTLGFGEVRTVLVSLGVQLQRLNEFNDLTSVSYIHLYDLAKALQTYAKTFVRVDEYNPVHDPNGDDKATLLRQLYDDGSALIRQLHIVNMQAHTNSIDTSSLERERLALENAVTAAEASVANIREASSKVGVAIYAQQFESEAKKHFAASWWFLVFASILLVVAFYLISYTNPTIAIEDLPVVVAFKYIHALARPLFALAGALFLLRLFSTERHNAILHRHRALALATFKTFVDGAHDDMQTRLAVLRSANETVFAARQTGYLRSPLGVRELKTPTISIISDDGNDQ